MRRSGSSERHPGGEGRGVGLAERLHLAGPLLWSEWPQRTPGIPPLLPALGMNRTVPPSPWDLWSSAPGPPPPPAASEIYHYVSPCLSPSDPAACPGASSPAHRSLPHRHQQPRPLGWPTAPSPPCASTHPPLPHPWPFGLSPPKPSPLAQAPAAPSHCCPQAGPTGWPGHTFESVC